MKIQIEETIKNSQFVADVLWSLKNCRPSTKRSCDAKIFRDGDGVEIELTARDGFGFTRSPARDVCRQLKNARIQIDGVDAWNITPDGFASGCTIVCTSWNGFEDIDRKEVCDNA